VADATNEVRLWRAANGDPHDIHDWFTDQLECDDVPYIARPRADDDAREERLKRAEAYATRCPLCRSELDVDEMEPDETDGLTEMRPDGAGVCGECYGRWHDAKVYKARAEKAERERDEARALLREARTVGIPIHRHEIAARIDAELDNPTPDDRKGEDGAWVERGGE